MEHILNLEQVKKSVSYTHLVKNFAKSYYTWSNSKEAIEARTQAINGYLTKELQDLNVDTIRTDIPTLSLIHISIKQEVKLALMRPPHLS